MHWVLRAAPHMKLDLYRSKCSQHWAGRVIGEGNTLMQLVAVMHAMS